jgi:hypothetical protein
MLRTRPSGRFMSQLQVDLWPAGLVMALAAIGVALMHALDRYADVRSARRTRAALQQALGGPTEE